MTKSCLPEKLGWDEIVSAEFCGTRGMDNFIIAQHSMSGQPFWFAREHSLNAGWERGTELRLGRALGGDGTEEANNVASAWSARFGKYVRVPGTPVCVSITAWTRTPIGETDQCSPRRKHDGGCKASEIPILFCVFSLAILLHTPFAHVPDTMQLPLPPLICRRPCLDALNPPPSAPPPHLTLPRD